VGTLRERLKAQAKGVLPVGSTPVPQGAGVTDSEKKECLNALQAVVQAKNSGEKLYPPSGIMPLIC